MAFLRIQCDLAIPMDKASKPAVKAKLDELKALLKQAKTYSVKINAGKPEEEMTVKAEYHICFHDEKKACDPVVEI